MSSTDTTCDLRHLHERAGIPRRYLDAEPDHSHDSTLSTGRGLYVTGSVGTGKTHLACSVAMAFVDSHVQDVGGTNVPRATVRFVPSVDLLMELRSTYDERDASEDDVMGRYGTCDLLVLDDLGKDAPTDWALSRLYQLVNARYNACLPTIVTTQYGSKELAAAMARNGGVETAKAIISRLYESCEAVRVEGPDRRIHG